MLFTAKEEGYAKQVKYMYPGIKKGEKSINKCYAEVLAQEKANAEHCLSSFYMAGLKGRHVMRECRHHDVIVE